MLTPTHTVTPSSEGLIAQLSIAGSVSTTQSVILNILTIVLVAIILSLTANKNNLIKNRTLTTVVIFLLMQFSLPALINSGATSNILLLAVTLATPILFSSFQRNRAIEKSFIIALLFSIISLFNSHILYLLPIYALGLIQMQSASVRTFAAMFIGLITPYWIVSGVGLITPITVHFESLRIGQMTTFPGFEMTTIIVIMVAGFLAGCYNLLLALNEKMQVRVKNGFINILSVGSALLMIVDSAHYITYLPVLNYCVTLQIGYLFSSRQSKISHIILYSMIVLVMAWQVYLYCL